LIQELVLAAFFLLCFARPAEAASCSTYASSLVFGVYFGSTVDVAGSVTVICTQGTTYNIGLNSGIASGTTVYTRVMTGGAGGQSSLGYMLYSNAAYTNVWGNTSGTGWVAGTGTGSAQTYAIYGQIPANEASPLGSYTDTIAASVTGNFSTVTTMFSVTATVMAGCNIFGEFPELRHLFGLDRQLQCDGFSFLHSHDFVQCRAQCGDGGRRDRNHPGDDRCGRSPAALLAVFEFRDVYQLGQDGRLRHCDGNRQWTVPSAYRLWTDSCRPVGEPG
jgi:spore coat protein U-like protein